MDNSKKSNLLKETTGSCDELRNSIIGLRRELFEAVKALDEISAEFMYYGDVVTESLDYIKVVKDFVKLSEVKRRHASFVRETRRLRSRRNSI